MAADFYDFTNGRKANYLSVSGVITRIASAASRGFGGCTQMITVENDQGQITNFLINGNTCMVDAEPLREGMSVTMFYNGNLPAPLIYPPQFMASVAARQIEGRTIYVGLFDRNLLAVDRSLKLNLASNTEIVTCNHQIFRGEPGGHVLVVLYSWTTRSLPPQTTPEKIIVLCGQ